MADYKPYVGDIGTRIEIDMQEDLTDWSELKYLVSKPTIAGSREEKTWTAARKGDAGGDEEILSHTVVADDFDAPGMYYVQPYGEVSGWKGKGDTISFMVYSKYK